MTGGYVLVVEWYKSGLAHLRQQGETVTLCGVDFHTRIDFTGFPTCLRCVVLMGDREVLVHERRDR